MKMSLMASFVFAVGAAFAYNMGDTVAATAGACTFRINTKDSPQYGYTIDDVASFPVTWREGETVNVTDRNGDAATGYPSSAAALDGSKSFDPSVGGVWTLVNSESGTAYIVVPWLPGEMGDVLAATGIGSPFGVDTLVEGPDRKGKKKELISTAFSGDDWAGHASAESTLRFTAPDSTVTSIAKTGTGSHSFTFDQTGAWTVELIVDSVVVKTATINATSGLVIFVK
jgi:hypothetical protein